MNELTIFAIKYFTIFFLSFCSLLSIIATVEVSEQKKRIAWAVVYVLIIISLINIDMRIIGPVVMSQVTAWLLMLIKIILIAPENVDKITAKN